MSRPPDAWRRGAEYERYIGRWSKLVARDFLGRLNAPPGGRWLDVGCGTGVLTRAILELTEPGSVVGIDPSEGFVEHARRATPNAHFEVADARSLPFETGAFDTVVSGLVLNFIPEPAGALAEMTRVARAEGVVSVYVWDYAGRMDLLRYFFDAAMALDPAATELDEARRFAAFQPDPMRQLFETAGLHHITTAAIDITMSFRDFDDYWTPFLGGQGPAPAYAMSLDEDRRAHLRERLRQTLPTTSNGAINLAARAWSVQGRKPPSPSGRGPG
jgi:SAM-dependent methyltransferase